ncbi:MAG: hypothetical protein ACRDOO_15185 [Actinomadura sp.]
MSFSLNERRLPLYQAEDSKYQPLGAWIITDISIYRGACLDALAMLSDVSAGRPTFEPWDSENYTVHFAPTGVSIQNDWVEHERGEFSVADVRVAVEDYWRFLASLPDNPNLIREYRPDLPEWQAALLRWEEKWSRRHPYHGVLF